MLQLERALANDRSRTPPGSLAHPVSVRCRLVGHEVLLRITDRGPGIRRENLERIFEAFYRTDNHAGSGLGLAIARGFVEVNGGHIQRVQVAGQGTCFVLRFRAPANSLAEEPAAR